MKSRSPFPHIVAFLFASLLLLQTACTTAPPPVIPPADSDQDGIFDTADVCPNTAPGVLVNSNGCPQRIDTDGDDVVDALDSCPETPAQTEVDVQGCPVIVLPEPPQTLTLEYQPDDGIDLLKTAAALTSLNDFIKENPGRHLIIEGHTDSIGNKDLNMKNSLLRAEKIKTYLTQTLGIEENRVEARGFGETNPIADNNSQEGRRQNRRVIIIALPLE